MALRAPQPTTETAAPSRKGFTRRQALAAAVATGVSVGAVRLLGGTIQNITRSSKAAGTDWVSPLSRESAQVAQLLRRTTFGYTQAQLDAALSDGYTKTVDRLLETKPQEPPALAAAATRSRPRSRPASASAPSDFWAEPSRTSRVLARPPAPTGCRL